jgi:RHS repeat-associated protein
LSVIQPNGAGATTYLYEGNTVKVTSPSGKWKKYEMDGLGRLVKVFEPQPGGGTYETSYLYNPAGKLKQVIMPRDGVTQNRYFNYDTTAGTRLLSAQNPENGTVSYSYNSDGTVNFKTDAKGIKTEYSYDQHKRVSQMRKLPNGSTENRCERVDYFYDENGGTNNGRLTRMRWGWDASNQACTDPSTGFGIGFEEVYTYNAAGRTSTKTFNYAGRTLSASWTYDNEGKLLTQTYPSRASHPGTNRTVDFTYDAMARLQRVRSSWDWNINTYQDVAANAVYNTQGALTSLSILGSTETRQYNALGQLTRITGLGIDLEYRFSATQNDGKITQQKNWVSGEEVTYLYDELERLGSAATTSTAWGLSWSYDGFGNRLAQNLTKGTGPTNSTLVDANTNRISSFGYLYDQNGNMTNMPQQNAQLTYDSSNRMTRFSDLNDAESYQYAPDNKRIWRSKGCSYYNYTNGNYDPRPQIIFYSVFGQKLGEYCLMENVTVIREYVYFGGRMVARSNGYNLESFKTDRLHSNQDAPGGGFFPYGETKSGAATTGESFATYSRDWHGLDYADQRNSASSLGRFGSSDPFVGSASAMIPLSFNRYSYVLGDSVNYFDPNGLSTEVLDDGRFRTCTMLGEHQSCFVWGSTPNEFQNGYSNESQLINEDIYRQLRARSETLRSACKQFAAQTFNNVLSSVVAGEKLLADHESWERTIGVTLATFGLVVPAAAGVRVGANLLGRLMGAASAGDSTALASLISQNFLSDGIMAVAGAIVGYLATDFFLGRYLTQYEGDHGLNPGSGINVLRPLLNARHAKEFAQANCDSDHNQRLIHARMLLRLTGDPD